MSRAPVVAAPLLTFALVACGGDSESGASGPSAPGPVIDIRGTITEIGTVGPDVSLGGIAIEGEEGADTRYSSAWVRISDGTRIWRRRDAALEPASELQPGMRVEVKFSGAVALSDPVQATAAEITIID